MASLPWSTQLSEALTDRIESGRYRSHRVRSGSQGVHIEIAGNSFISFCSNDYLGLANHPSIKKAFISAIEQQGTGAGAAHLLTGQSRCHQQLEEALIEFTGQERVLLFSSGYQANIGVIDGLMAKGDVIIQDKLNHASLLDGGRLSAATQLRYQHADMAALSRRLSQSAEAQHRLIVTDGVFSMDGDIAPLKELLSIAKECQAGVFVDDAHAFGVLGDKGAGSTEYWQLNNDELPIVMGTFGKALGTAGAFVAADEVVIETLIQHARSYIYTTAQPDALAAATLQSLKLVQEESWRRDKLLSLIAQFKQGAAQLGLNLLESMTPIQPIVVGDVKAAVAWGEKLEQQGILVGVIRPPTVPEGSARLRITLSADHSERDIEKLLTALEQMQCI